MSGAIDRLRYTWNQVVWEYINGRRLHPDPLDRWFSSYSGGVDERGMPDPYIGPLDRTPRAVFLALGPGAVAPELQGPAGLFAEEIRELGSHSAWAATCPYLRHPWLRWGRNRFHYDRLRFSRRWHDDPALEPAETLVLQLYPWHTTRVVRKLAPDPGIVRDFVWEPLTELGAETVFAFGAPWFPMLEHGLGLEVVDLLGEGGRDYGSRATGRTVLVCRPPDGPLVVAEKHPGSAGPPSEEETELLRDALRSRIT